jgi:AcrR family transcriptional regulator
MVTGSGTIPDRKDFAARDRLLLAATQLLDEAAGGPVSTREITERAGVRAPTLYHHFGSKQALLDAVVSHGFKEFLRSRGAGSENNDALEDVRARLGQPVAFGLEFPGAYAHIYGNVKPGVLCRVTEDVRAHLLEALQPAASQAPTRISRRSGLANPGRLLRRHLDAYRAAPKRSEISACPRECARACSPRSATRRRRPRI